MRLLHGSVIPPEPFFVRTYHPNNERTPRPQYMRAANMCAAMTDYRSHCHDFLIQKGMSEKSASEMIDAVESALNQLFDIWMGEHPVQLVIGDKSRKLVAAHEIDRSAMIDCKDANLTKLFEDHAAKAFVHDLEA